MCASKMLFAYLLLVFNIAVMFFLKQKLASSTGETVFIFLAIIFAFLILRGLSKEKVWVWPALMVFIALALANAVYFFVLTKILTAFLAVTVINLFGLVYSLIWSIEEDEIPHETEELRSDEFALPTQRPMKTKKNRHSKKKTAKKQKNKR